MLVEILIVELRLESIGLGKAVINLEDLRVRSGPLPTFHSACKPRADTAQRTNLFKRIRPGSLSGVRINGDEHKVHGIALVRRDDAD